MGIAYIVSDGHVMMNGSTNEDSLYCKFASDGHILESYPEWLILKL